MADPEAREFWRENSWPGLKPKPDEIDYDADKLKGIAKELLAGLERLEGLLPGSVRDVQRHAKPLGNPVTTTYWEAGAILFESIDNAYYSISDIYPDVIAKYRAALGKVYTGAGVMDWAELLNNKTKSV
ncbi:hypothetical protein [Nonomuraea roseola]|uniref:Uncharacterized protein n=1 Tax=Nonomuraea roseola TaxID=46179 RepID=A0ABV5PQZ9_9ACTN